MRKPAFIILAAGLLLGALTWGATPAHAQTQAASQAWPQRPVKLLLPLGPGSGADITARLFGDRLTKRWGQTVVVENRPGADGIVAITAFINARDDHTLLFGPSSSFVGHPYLHEKMPYDPRELAPIARITNTLVAVAVPATVKADTVADVVSLARKQPGSLNWATVTGVTDIIVAGYAKNAGLETNKIPYRDTVQALNDLGEGRIQLYVAALAIVQPQVQSGRVKLLAVTNRERAPGQPQLPTVTEAGFPALSFDGLTGLYGPRDMPADLKNRIAADIKAVADDPEILARLSATGQVVRPGTPDEFAAAIDEQAAQLATAAKALGITPKQ